MRHVNKETADAEAWHIASLVVHCRPESLADTAAAIDALDDCSVPEREASGKLVALIEGPDEARLMRSIRAIEELPAVVSTSFVFHQIDN